MKRVKGKVIKSREKTFQRREKKEEAASAKKRYFRVRQAGVLNLQSGSALCPGRHSQSSQAERG